MKRFKVQAFFCVGSGASPLRVSQIGQCSGMNQQSRDRCSRLGFRIAHVVTPAGFFTLDVDGVLQRRASAKFGLGAIGVST